MNVNTGEGVMKNEIHARVCVCVLYQFGNTPSKDADAMNKNHTKVAEVLQKAGGARRGAVAGLCEEHEAHQRRTVGWWERRAGKRRDVCFISFTCTYARTRTRK